MNTYIIIVDNGGPRQLNIQDQSEHPYDKWQGMVSAQIRSQGLYTAQVTLPDGSSRKTDVVVKGTATVLYMTQEDVASAAQRAQLASMGGSIISKA